MKNKAKIVSDKGLTKICNNVIDPLGWIDARMMFIELPLEPVSRPHVPAR